jgi:hypothetical protein
MIALVRPCLRQLLQSTLVADSEVCYFRLLLDDGLLFHNASRTRAINRNYGSVADDSSSE